MAPPFVFPSVLKDLEEDLEEDILRVLCPVHVSGLRPSQVEDLVKGVTFDLSDRELFCIEEQDVFDRVYSLVKEFSTLTPSLKLNLVETLRSNLSVLLPSIDSLSRAVESSPGYRDDASNVADRMASHLNALKIYSFFLLSIATAQECQAETAGASSKVS